MTFVNFIYIILYKIFTPLFIFMRKILLLIVVGVLSSISITSAYTQEQQTAYKWAYSNKLTTQKTIESANLNGNITRQAMAKMIVNYLENVKWSYSYSWKLCSFPDENKITPDLVIYAKKACTYNIMWTNGRNFKPSNNVTRAELWTIISRIVRGDKYNTTKGAYYTEHLKALKANWIMNKIDNPETTYAKRYQIMVMLYRLSANNNIWNSQIEKIKYSIYPTTTNKQYYYPSDYNNPPLSKAMKELKLRSTNCPRIFCQEKADDWTFINQKHYYRDENQEIMIELTWVYYVSDCNYYDEKFLSKKSSELDFQSSFEEDYPGLAKKFIDGNGKTYTYTWFLEVLYKLAKESWEKDIERFIKIEIEHNKSTPRPEELVKTMEFLNQIEDIDTKKLNHDETVKYINDFKNSMNDALKELEDIDDKYISDLNKILDSGIQNDKFALKDTIWTISLFKEYSWAFVSEYMNTRISLAETSLWKEISEDEATWVAIKVLWLSFAYGTRAEVYQDYMDSWVQDVYDVLTKKKSKVKVKIPSWFETSILDDLDNMYDNAQWRKRDIERLQDLARIETAIIYSQQDHWAFPWTEANIWKDYNDKNTTDATKWLMISEISNNLMDGGLNSVLTDPDNSNRTYGLWKFNNSDSVKDWEYIYLVAKRNGITNWWFALMANSETEGWSNWVVCENKSGLENWYLTGWTDLKDVRLCTNLTKWNSCSTQNCTYKDENELRQLILY